MSNEPEYITCPDCDAVFCVVWNNMPETQGGPDYCPFCGTQLNYEDCVHKPEDD